MSPGLKKDGGQRWRHRWRHRWRLAGVLCFLLSVGSLPRHVEGFALKSCTISGGVAVCANMKLKVVPREIPATVEGLDLGENLISNVRSSDFTDLPLLKELDLKRNNITLIHSRAFAALTFLQKLNLNSNKLVQLDQDLFAGLSLLTELRVASNRIKVVASSAFTSMKSLTFLDVSHNKLRDVAKLAVIWQQLPRLRTLHVKNNQFTTFHSWELSNRPVALESLDVSQNSIVDFQITADVFPNLTWFNIGGALRKRRMKWNVSAESAFSQVSTLDISRLQMSFDHMKLLFGAVSGSLASLRMNAMTSDLSALVSASCGVPTMSTLQLRSNKLRFVSADFIRRCVGLAELDLAENKIKNIHDDAFVSTTNLRILILSRNRLVSVPLAVRSLSLIQLNLGANNISRLGCEDFVNQTKLQRLDLQNNSISALEECVFQDLVGLKVLQLQNNHMSRLNAAFGNHLPDLRQLRLHGNELTSLRRREFAGLRSLQSLHLDDNKLETLEVGCFVGLTNLSELLLQKNDIVANEINNGCFNIMTNLRRLDLRENHIHYESSAALSRPPFSGLSRLETLVLTSQHRRLKAQLPRNLLKGLTNLLVFSVRNNQLLHLDKDTFIHTPQLQVLDISSNDLTELSADLFLHIHELKTLYISRTQLGSLFYLSDAKLRQLEFLQARHNQYSVVSEDIVESLPALVYVDFQGNSFTCDCDNAWFVHWVKDNNKTQVYDAYNFECNYPVDLKGRKLLDLDISQCSVDTEYILFVSTVCAVLLFMAASFVYHFLRDHLSYTYYLLLSMLFDQRHKNKAGAAQYDAFVSYSVHDEAWVVRELLPKLEGHQGWRLCLHHRDFQPGKPIIENIADAIYGSRKTICVISRRYLKSEWCSKEIQLASFRLFHEQKDVLILVFLEDIPTSELSPYYNVRKLLRKKTYLSWTRAADHTGLFWEKLGTALKTKDEDSLDPN